MRDDGMTMRLVDSLYVEAMVLADEAHGYFDSYGRAERDLLAPLARVTFTCESLKVTTRLTHIIAWLLTRRALAAGEISEHDARDPSRRPHPIAEAGENDLACLPDMARALIRASDDLYRRVGRLQAGLNRPIAPSPARGLVDRLENAF